MPIPSSHPHPTPLLGILPRPSLGFPWTGRKWAGFDMNFVHVGQPYFPTRLHCAYLCPFRLVIFLVVDIM